MSLLLASIFAGAGSLVSTGAGIAQYISGRRRERNAGDRPQYQTPKEVEDALNLARTRASRGQMPGEGIAREMTREATASSMNVARQAARTPSDLIGAAVGLGGNQMRAGNQLALSRAQYQDNAEAQLTNQLGFTAQFRDKEFELNEREPWMQEMAAASAMQGAGLQNIVGGVGDLSGGMANIFYGQYLKEGMQGNRFQPNQPSISGAGINPNVNLQNSFMNQVQPPRFNSRRTLSDAAYLIR